MGQKKQLTIIEFSRLTGIKRENLRFYDRIGLLTPTARGENNYRYYSRHQLSEAYLIGDLRRLGVGIEDIKQYAAERTPEKTLALFAQQEVRIQAELRQLRETSLIMRMHSDMVRETLLHGENAPFLQEKKREPIFLCPPIPDDMDDDEGGIFSYDYAEVNGINLGFPQGTLISREGLYLGAVAPSGRYYFKMGSGGNAYKPSGLYAVACGRYDPWKSLPLYLILLDFIKDNGLQICGDAYEEYPLDDTAVQNREQFCVRVEIPVTKR